MYKRCIFCKQHSPYSMSMPSICYVRYTIHVAWLIYSICYVHIACVRLSIYIWHAIYRVRLMTTIRRPFWFGTQQQICWKLVHVIWSALTISHHHNSHRGAVEESKPLLVNHMLARYAASGATRKHTRKAICSARLKNTTNPQVLAETRCGAAWRTTCP